MVILSVMSLVLFKTAEYDQEAPTVKDNEVSLIELNQTIHELEIRMAVVTAGDKALDKYINENWEKLLQGEKPSKKFILPCIECHYKRDLRGVK